MAQQQSKSYENIQSGDTLIGTYRLGRRTLRFRIVVEELRSNNMASVLVENIQSGEIHEEVIDLEKGFKVGTLRKV